MRHVREDERCPHARAFPIGTPVARTVPQWSTPPHRLVSDSHERSPSGFVSLRVVCVATRPPRASVPAPVGGPPGSAGLVGPTRSGGGGDRGAPGQPSGASPFSADCYVPL